MWNNKKWYQIKQKPIKKMENEPTETIPKTTNRKKKFYIFPRYLIEKSNYCPKSAPLLL